MSASTLMISRRESLGYAQPETIRQAIEAERKAMIQPPHWEEPHIQHERMALLERIYTARVLGYDFEQ